MRRAFGGTWWVFMNVLFVVFLLLCLCFFLCCYYLDVFWDLFNYVVNMRVIFGYCSYLLENFFCFEEVTYTFKLSPESYSYSLIP
jgi:hypothetical protein